VALWEAQRSSLSQTSAAGEVEDYGSDDEEDVGFEDEEELGNDLDREVHRRRAEEPEVVEESMSDFLRDVAAPKKLHVEGVSVALSSFNRPLAERPSKVVKRTTRYLLSDGTEVLEIGACLRIHNES
jgi:hypothetical protein